MIYFLLLSINVNLNIEISTEARLYSYKCDDRTDATYRDLFKIFAMLLLFVPCLKIFIFLVNRLLRM